MSKTPQEAAKELLTLFSVEKYKNKTRLQLMKPAKVCALICADIVIENLEAVGNGSRATILHRYWLDVKTQLETL